MPPKGDRSARIAAAVERSKTEYQSQHAYTERDEAHANWLSEGSGSGVGNGMGGKYGLEYVAARAYNLETSGGVKVPEGGEGGGQTLDAIWERVDKGKPLGGLSKEVLDSAMVIAVRRGDSRAGELADLSKSCWKAPHVGIAFHAAQAYIMLDRHQEPLLQASLAGIHHPILVLLAGVLDKLLDSSCPPSLLSSSIEHHQDDARSQIEAFRSLVISQRDRSTYSYDLFPPHSSSSAPASATGAQITNGGHTDPRAESALSDMADVEVGTSTLALSDGNAPAESSATDAQGPDIGIAKLAAALQVQEGTLRTAMGRLMKQLGSMSAAEEGKERAERGVREL